MKYTPEQIGKIKNEIISILQTNNEVRFGEISRIIISKGLVDSSFIIKTILETGCRESDRFNGREFFKSPKVGIWALSKNNDKI